MPDFSGRTDRELLDTLSAIAKDPESYVPTAREEIETLLCQRHPGVTLSALPALIEANEQAVERRQDWIETRTEELLRGQALPSSPSPDPQADASAIRSARSSTGFAILRESLLVLAIPALLALGVLYEVAPDSLWLEPFRAMQHLPYLKVIGALPWAMAKLIEVVFALLPPGYALPALGGLVAVLVLAALWHVVVRIRHLIWLRKQRSLNPAGGG
jgi:hypothetical protein